MMPRLTVAMPFGARWRHGKVNAERCRTDIKAGHRRGGPRISVKPGGQDTARRGTWRGVSARGIHLDRSRGVLDWDSGSWTGIEQTLSAIPPWSEEECHTWSAPLEAFHHGCACETYLRPDHRGDSWNKCS